MLRPLFSWLLSFAVVPALVLTAVRLLLTPAFIQVEYRLPGFPPDPFDFSTAERLYWADLSRQYLLRKAPRAALADQRLTDGRPLYSARELRHLADVQRVVQGALKVWYASLALLLASGLWAWRQGEIPFWRQALARGGWLTVAVVGAVMAFSVLSFDAFFVPFHWVFLEGRHTWLFRYSDTLIRLFPQRFWQDAFLWVGGLSLLGAWGLIRLHPKGPLAR